MNLGELKYAEGSKKKRKRIGRGPGSGHGKTACRGNKGQKSRSGSKTRSWFEGGQMPLQRRVPKRGFTNIFKKTYQVVNVGDLEKIKASPITSEELYKARLIRKKDTMIKVLGNGDVSKAIEVQAHKFSEQAVKKLEKAGGKAIKL